MKKTRLFLIILLCLGLCCSVVVMAGAEQSCTGLQAQQCLGDQAYKGTADAVLLYELTTQTLVYAHNPDTRLNPTGIIKILTALLILEEGNLSDMVTAQRSTLNSVGIGVVSAGLQAGEMMSLEDLLYCIMVSSANDACAVAAEHVAGSQAAFVEKMNARAATLGCVNTHFTNVHGLMDERQYSTARDLAIITAEALKNPEFVRLFGIVNHTVAATNLSPARSLTTTNNMMLEKSPYYDARVTGGKPAAATTRDRSQVCTAQVGDSRYLCVVMSAEAKVSGNTVTSFTNFKEAETLLDYGFEGFAVQQVFGTGQPYGQYPVTDGENHVVVAADSDIYAMLPIGFAYDDLEFRDVMDRAVLVAPLETGVKAGTLQILYRGIVIGQTALLTQHDVAQKGTTIRTVDNGENGGGAGFARVLLWIAAVVGAVILVGFMALALLRYYYRMQTKRRRRRMKEKGRI